MVTSRLAHIFPSIGNSRPLRLLRTSSMLSSVATVTRGSESVRALADMLAKVELIRIFNEPVETIIIIIIINNFNNRLLSS